MKVLPNELHQDPDVEKVKKKEEYVFKKDEELITPVDLSIETNEIGSVMPTGAIDFKSTNTSEPFMEIISSIDSSNEIGLMTPTPTDGVQIMIIERIDLEKTVTHQMPEELNIPTASDDENELRANEVVTVFSTNEIDSNQDKESLLNLPNGGILEGSIFETYHPYDDDIIEPSDKNDTEEDYSAEILKPRPTLYSSKQRTMPSSTLLHGFLTNPGYPSFYIGKSNDCKWKLKLDDGQRIALTVLDLHLRSKTIEPASRCVCLSFVSHHHFQSTIIARTRWRLSMLAAGKVCIGAVRSLVDPFKYNRSRTMLK